MNILPILLDTVMDFSFHDIADQYDQSGNERFRIEILQRLASTAIYRKSAKFTKSFVFAGARV